MLDDIYVHLALPAIDSAPMALRIEQDKGHKAAASPVWISDLVQSTFAHHRVRLRVAALLSLRRDTERQTLCTVLTSTPLGTGPGAVRGWGAAPDPR